MKRVYSTANGKQINIDSLIAQNEDTIAVGNMKVNARGDQLGAGGKVEVPREKVMNDYYKLNTPVAVDNPPQPHQVNAKKDLVDDWVEEPIQQKTIDESTDAATPPAPEKPALRGSLADSIAKNKPAEKEVPKKAGPSRI
ncbi:hypothetical protein UFOVP257_313 [uncultured Caudovirales phage]|uniref:Uncharacterized protein n=1 Tax=uncultured Caudovirales phage TaxID=2100421 RepID=A0A6J5LHC8_9CAUD|nr:hypothetical protein UFOVP257_313 [uncultured Caudovirales phage]